MIISVQFKGDRELIAKLERMSGGVRKALELKVKVLALKLENLVKTGKLNGQVLNRITGRLARSIDNKVLISAFGVRGIVYSSGDVKYAGIHEFGGTTAPHIILPKKAQALSFVAGGKQVFAKKVNHPGSKMPERSFLRSSLRDMSTEISTGLKSAVVQAAKEGIR